MWALFLSTSSLAFLFRAISNVDKMTISDSLARNQKLLDWSSYSLPYYCRLFCSFKYSALFYSAVPSSFHRHSSAQVILDPGKLNWLPKRIFKLAIAYILSFPTICLLNFNMVICDIWKIILTSSFIC